MVFSKEDRILIEQLHLFKGYGTKKLATQFLEKKCQVRSVNRLKPNPITLSGSKLVANKFEAGRRPASKPVCGQLRTSFEPASVMEFRFY